MRTTSHCAKTVRLALALPLLCIVSGCCCQALPLPGEGNCPTDARALYYSCGEEAVRRCPCGPDREFYGLKPTQWRSWPEGWRCNDGRIELPAPEAVPEPVVAKVEVVAKVAAENPGTTDEPAAPIENALGQKLNNPFSVKAPPEQLTASTPPAAEDPADDAIESDESETRTLAEDEVVPSTDEDSLVIVTDSTVETEASSSENPLGAGLQQAIALEPVLPSEASAAAGPQSAIELASEPKSENVAAPMPQQAIALEPLPICMPMIFNPFDLCRVPQIAVPTSPPVPQWDEATPEGKVLRVDDDLSDRVQIHLLNSLTR